MPFYEMAVIASHFKNFASLRDLVRSSALHIMEHGGHVRKIESWGTHTLPERMRRHKVNHEVGDYFFIQFDASPVTARALDDQYRIDPRVIRRTLLNLGESVKQVSAPPRATEGWGSSSLADPLASPSSGFNTPPHLIHSTPTLLNEERRAQVLTQGRAMTSERVGAGAGAGVRRDALAAYAAARPVASRVGMPPRAPGSQAPRQ